MMEGRPRQALNAEFQTLLEHHEELLDGLEKLIADLELIEDGWTVHFVVDFQVVYQYAFRKETLLRQHERNGLDGVNRERYVREQAALSFLFHGRRRAPPPLMLPPHEVELRNTIMYHRLQSMRGRTEHLFLDAIKERALTLLDTTERSTIEKATDWSARYGGEPLPGELQSAMYRIAFSRFADVVYLMSGSTSDGFRRLNKLLKGSPPKLQLASPLVQEHHDLLERAMKARKSRWDIVFATIRPTKPAANRADARVIDAVLALNDELARQQRKEFVCLFSDAPAMTVALNLERYPQYRDKARDFQNPLMPHPLCSRRLKIHRSPEIFLLYMMAAEADRGPHGEDATATGDTAPTGATRARTLTNLRGMRDRIYEFRALIPSIREAVGRCSDDCDHCDAEQSRQCRDIKHQIETHRASHDKLVDLAVIENRLYVLKDDGEADGLLRPDSTIGALDRCVLALAGYLGGNSEALSKLIESEIDGIEKTLEDLEPLARTALPMAPKAMEKLHACFQRFQRLPFHLTYEKAESRKIVDRMRLHFENPLASGASFASLLDEYLRLTRDPILGNDRYLLLAVLYYNQAQFDWVVRVTEDVMSKANAQRSECLLVRILAQHQLALRRKDRTAAMETLRDCSNGLREHDGDWRFLYVQGVAIGQMMDEGLLVVSDVPDPAECFEKALSLASSADAESRGWLENAIAYSLVRRDELSREDLARSGRHLDALLDLLARPKWPPNFVDTLACLDYHRGRLATDDNVAQRLLRNALEGHVAAVRQAREEGLLGWEVSRIESHIDRVRAEIARRRRLSAP